MNKLFVLYFKTSVRYPYLLFSPFLLLSVMLALSSKQDVFIGDDGIRYWTLANNLIHGFFSPPPPGIDLINGPGLPILLIPIVALKLPVLCISIMNAIFHFLSIVFLYKALLKYLTPSKSIIFTLLYAFCFSAYHYIFRIMTEPLCYFLISVFVYSLVIGINTERKKYLIISGFTLGYLALTKIIFAYVILVMLILVFILVIVDRQEDRYKKSFIVMVVAFAVTVPYMIYTFSLTGKVFYWGSAGNDSLYWMSTPFEHEYGAWNNESFDANSEGIEKIHSIALLKANHQKDFDSISKLNSLARDNALKEIALRNIKNHPFKYIKNCISNVSRLLFNFPQNYVYQLPIKRIWYFAIIYTLMLYCLIITIMHWRKISFCIKLVFAFSFIYLGGSSLVSGDNRQFIIILPALLVWIGYIFQRSVRIKYVE